MLYHSHSPIKGGKGGKVVATGVVEEGKGTGKAVLTGGKDCEGTGHAVLTGGKGCEGKGTGEEFTGEEVFPPNLVPQVDPTFGVTTVGISNVGTSTVRRAAKQQPNG